MKRLFLLAGLLLCSLCILCACSGAPEAPTEPTTYTVSYLVGSSVYTTQTVAQGQLPQPVQVQRSGLEVTGWLDEQGQPVLPEAEPVLKDRSYNAQVSPRLVLHMPYLQLDEQGLLHPDEALSGQALEYALQALTPEAAWEFFPELPTGEQVSGLQLKQALYPFFSPEQVDGAVLAGDTDPVTRAMLAGYLNPLLGRDADESFILAASAQLPKDVTVLRADAAILLEASVRHSPDPQGQSWQALALPTGWEPGFRLEEGWLYYVQPDGTLLRDGQQGKLYFGKDGRYTSGDPELDQLVATTLHTIVQENPELEGLELLRQVFDHCHEDYKYLRKDAYNFGATGWEVEDAKEMLQKGRGNCYNFAAIFWALASGMGYDVQCLAGTCTGTDQPHGWVVLQYEGVYYFVDPEWQYAYTEREVFDKDMFMLTMDEVWWWTYRWDESQFSA